MTLDNTATSPVDSSAPASSPGAVQTPDAAPAAPAAPAQPAQATPAVDHEDAALRKIFDQHGIAHPLPADDAQAPPSEPQDTPDPAAPAQPTSAAPTADPAAATPGTSTEETDLLRRFQLESSDLPADPTRRERLLSNLRDRQKRDDSIGREKADLQKRLDELTQGVKPEGEAAPPSDPTPPAPEPTADPDLNEAWKKAAEEVFGGEAFGEPVKKAVLATTQKLTAPLVQQIAQLQNQLQQQAAAQWGVLQEMHISAGLQAAKQAVPGVNVDDPAVNQAVLEEATRLIEAERSRLGEKYDLRKFNYAQAIPRAVSVLYPQQLNQTAAGQLAARQAAAVKGSAVNTVRSPSAPRRLTADELDDALAKAALEGKGRTYLEELQRQNVGG